MRRTISSFISRSHVKTILLSLFLATLALTFHAFSLGRAANPILVNSYIDRVKNDGRCTLREAVIAANTDSASGSKHGECVAGSGSDVISFRHPGNYRLTLSDFGGEDLSRTGDLDIDGDLTILAEQPGVVIIGHPYFHDRIIHIHSGEVVISGVVIKKGQADGDGGGIYVSATGSLLLENSTLTHNTSSGRGGALANDGAIVSIINSTFSGNAAADGGGGIAALGGTTTLNNLTITGNWIDPDDEVGGGAGLLNEGGAINIQNTLIAGNFDSESEVPFPDCKVTGEYSFPTNGHNLIGDTTGCSAVFVDGVDGNLAGTSTSPLDAQLEPLADNGGKTPTHEIQASSPARNSGDTASCAAADQRGVTRPQGPACDIGAYELENNEPDAVDDSYIVDEDSVVNEAAPGVLGNDSDLDGDDLTAVLEIGPANGGLTLNLDGSFSYTPTLNYYGPDSFTYRASDGFDSSPGVVSLTVNPINDPPVAVDDSATTDEDIPVLINVVANDFDIDSLVVGSSVNIQSNPAIGSVTNNGDGTLTYTPGLDLNGPDSFTYQVSDDGGLPSNVAIVTILVNPINDPPTAADDSYELDEDSVLSLPSPGVLGNDSDVDGDDLTVFLEIGPANGVLNLSPDGTFSYTPTRNYDGPDSFTYFANDGIANSLQPASVDLTVNSDGLIEVVNTASTGAGSLRAAIERANNTNTNPGIDTITFEVSGTIALTDMLPAISENVIISATLGEIVLDGTAAGSGANGLTITAGNSTVSGLTIINFAGDGILISQNGANLIAGNSIAYNGGAGISILADSQGNTISGNDIHDNGGLSVDLGGDGRTPNDQDDLDTGANFFQNYPVLIRATLPEGTLEITGRLNSSLSTPFALDFYASPACSLRGGGEQTYLGSTQASTDGQGNVYFVAADLPGVPAGYFINATATDPGGNTSEYSDCISVGPGNDSWPNAMRVTPGDGTAPAVVEDQFIDQPGQSRWYKFTVQPGSRVIATLTGLVANYDLSIYKDIAAAFKDVDSPADLARLGAEFAPDSFSPDSFSPDSFSPDSFSPDSFSPDSFSPDSFSPDSFSPDSFSSDIFSPDSFSPDSFSPDSFSPDSFSPDSFSPDSFSPDSFSPDSFSPDSFSSAQTRSLIGVSAFEGAAGEGIVVNSWNNSGDFYIRVRGRNGVFNPAVPFRLEVQLLTGSCSSITPLTVPHSIAPIAGGYQTIILADLARMSGSSAEIAALESSLASFVARPEIAGVVVDVGSDDRVAEANTQADAQLVCPYAKNQVAGAIKEIVDAYRAVNPLAYVVIVGDDSVIPFFRYPDNALLANEKNYIPPVRDSSASQASLKLGYVLGQDEYGSLVALSLKASTLPLPDLPVGRLVETAEDARTILDAYLATPAGVITPATQPLVTGYDFLEDAALAVQFELEQGMGQTADTLITARDVSPADPIAWSAADLSEKLFNNRYDLMFLAGHFSASSALAADYRTRVLASDLANAPVDLSNVIVFSSGCHAGYNIVNTDGIPQVTREPDWSQAFAQRGATLIAGTGYQYGDTDFIEYSERLYLEFSRQLRTGSGSVSIGNALVAAKSKYLADTVQLRGVHEKSFLEAAIFGLPMLSVDMPGERIDLVGEESIVSATMPYTSNPGLTLGLTEADVTVTPALVEQTVVLSNVVDLTPRLAFYLAGSDGVVTNPAEPTLPLELVSVGVPGTILRGVGFRGGSYSDIPNVLPLTGAPTTEIRGVHAPFISDVFFPIRPWSTNYFDQLQDPTSGTTRLAVTPAQFRSGEPGADTGTLRKYTSLDFRLFYSQNGDEYAAGSVPALADAPAIVKVTAIPVADVVDFKIQVVGNPAAGVQEVWVVYTTCDAGETCSGLWQPVDLDQNSVDSTLWEGSLVLSGIPAEDVRFMVQAANGVGLVSLATNLGAYFIPGFEANPGPTTLVLDPPVVSAAPYGTQTAFSAVLTSGGVPVVGERVTFRLGGVSRQAATGPDGRAATSLPLLGLPGLSDVRVSFAGTTDYLAAADTIPFEILRQATVLTLDQPASGSPQETALITTTLQAAGRRLIEKTVFFNISGVGGDYFEAIITDYAGRAVLGSLPLPAGTYSVDVWFSGSVPLPDGGTLSLTDERYIPSTVSGTLVLNAPPNCSAAYASPPEIWPLNKNLVLVSILGIVDPDGDPLSIVIESIFQDEPVGNGRHAPDGTGLGSAIAKVRAERDGNGDGRVYHVGFTASDGNGGFCSGEVLVPTVPHDQGGDPEAIDGGACYDSTRRNAPNICVP